MACTLKLLALSAALPWLTAGFGMDIHNQIGFAAGKYLTPQARFMVESILEPEYNGSIGRAASWADTVSRTTHRYSYTWHWTSANDNVRTPSQQIRRQVGRRESYGDSRILTPATAPTNLQPPLPPRLPTHRLLHPADRKPNLHPHLLRLRSRARGLPRQHHMPRSTKVDPAFRRRYRTTSTQLEWLFRWKFVQCNFQRDADEYA